MLELSLDSSETVAYNFRCFLTPFYLPLPSAEQIKRPINC
jgi:hypothetical protein